MFKWCFCSSERRKKLSSATSPTMPSSKESNNNQLFVYSINVVDKQNQELNKRKKKADFMKRVNWTYIGLMGGLTLITGLSLLLVTLTKTQLKVLFFSLSGILIVAGILSLILSFCYFDEFKGLVLESEDQFFHSPTLKKKGHYNPHTSRTSLDYARNSQIDSSVSGIGNNNPMMFLSVPDDNGYNSRRESGYSLASSCYSFDSSSSTNYQNSYNVPIAIPMPNVEST